VESVAQRDILETQATRLQAGFLVHEYYSIEFIGAILQ
jgi:hypothetical protein